MGLLSFLKSSAVAGPAARPVADAADDVQQIRLRARRRLIGAAVLVGLGVIGFPMVFETQPRPIPVDLPIDIPRKEAALPLVIPAAAPTPAPEIRPEPSVEAAAPVQIPAQASLPIPSQLPVPLPKIALETPKPAPEKSVAKPPDIKPDAARVQALLDGKSPVALAAVGSAAAVVPVVSAASANSGRYVVQVGAYADTKTAQDVRAKLEKLGFKTYTQAVETADGRRIRVRVGPFANREDADKMAAKVAGGGLKTVVLTL